MGLSEPYFLEELASTVGLILSYTKTPLHQCKGNLKWAFIILTPKLRPLSLPDWHKGALVSLRIMHYVFYKYSERELWECPQANNIFNRAGCNLEFLFCGKF